MISIIVLLLEIFTLRVLTILGITYRSQAIDLLMIGLFFLTYVIDTELKDNLKSIQIPLIVGLIFRVALLLFDIYGRRIYILPNSGADADMFYRLGVETSMGFDNQRGFFIDFLGFIFKSIGISRIYVQFLLMLCSVVSLHMVNRILLECNVNKEVRYRTMMIICLLPNFAILSSIMLRESIITMFISISLYFFVRWVYLKNEVYFLMALVISLVSMLFHSGVIAIPVAFLISRVIYTKEDGIFAISLGNVIISIVLLALVVFLLNRYGDVLLGKFRNVDSIDDIAAVGRLAGSTYAQYVGNSNSPFNMIIFTLPRLIFFQFSPMPFQWRGISDIIAFLFDSTFYLYVIFKALFSICDRQYKNKTIVILLLIVALSAMFVFAWGTSNSGTAIRHRNKMIVLYGVLLALSWDSMLPETSRVEISYQNDTSKLGNKYIKG